MPEWDGLTRVVTFLKALLPGGLWCAWWLCGVNWRKTWPVLAAGGWAPVVLLSILGTFIWTVIDPTPWTYLSFVAPPSFWLAFWGHLGTVILLVLAALLCGWLQGKFGWTPADIDLDPAPPERHSH
jgi:hypothetical protein